MDFITVRDLRIKTGDVWKKLEGEQDLVVTSNGRPIAVMTAVQGNTIEFVLETMRQARARIALKTLRDTTKQKGLEHLSLQDINAEIKTVRHKRKK